MKLQSYIFICSTLLGAYSLGLFQFHAEHFGQKEVAFLGVVSLISLIVTTKLIPIVKPVLLKAELFGYDINKNGKEKVPESLGIVAATVYMMAVISFQWIFRSTLGIYNAALISMTLMLFLGFADDVLDLRWSIKIFFSFLAAYPLLMAYTGATTIIIPPPLRPFLGLSMDLGFLYHFYMACTVVFCTNSINIFAGINGLETGQSAIIAGSILIHNFLQLLWVPQGVSEAHQYLLSIFLVLPFLATNLGLLFFNWYPSQVFVGDTFTYFAGITFAVAGVLGHFSKTLLLLFLPQLFNFVYSLPQLFRIVPCPRHRLPKLNPKTGLLEPSKIPDTNVMNMTLINLWLKIFGPKHERRLCIELLVFQAFCTAVALTLRYKFEDYYYHPYIAN